MPVYVPFKVWAFGEAALVIWIKAVKKRTCNTDSNPKVAMMAYRKGLKLDPVRAKCPGPELERWAALISSCLSTYILYVSEVLRTTH